LTAEKLSQLYQPFNRLGQEATGGVAGTGIGLVVTKRLLELMGGVLGVESTVGKGSVFWFELTTNAAPQLEADPDAVVAHEKTPTPVGMPIHTLLYVEDNKANMDLVQQIVSRRPDLRLLTAVNGLDGIALARKELPTVILMDINLPGISGVAAMEMLRADPATAHIPVVALSANANPHDIATSLAKGFFRYLTKPIKLKEFTSTVNEAIQARKAGPS
jgi:CheY-like chemotaxis protein